MGSLALKEVLTTTDSLPIPQQNILSLEHPCIIQNVDRGIKSLGGTHQLNRLLELEQNVETSSFPVKLRPDDVFASVLPSKLLVTSNLLLKFTVPKRTGRKRKRGSSDPFVEHISDKSSQNLHKVKHVFQASRDNQDDTQVSVVGTVRHTHRYRSMSQFQYAASANSFMQDVKDKLLSQDFDEMKSFTIDSAQLLRSDQEVQPPPIMQITEIPYPYSYRQNASVKVFKDATGLDVSINDAKPGRIVHSIISYDAEDVPTAMSDSLTPEDELETRHRRIIAVLRAGLKQRPIMSTRYQFHLTKEAIFGTLRKALPYCGYMFKGGPFKDCLIRFGLDPRKDPVYRGYQVTQVQLLGIDKLLTRFGVEPEKQDRERPDTYVFDGSEVWTDSKVYHFCDVTDPVLRDLLDRASIPDEYEKFAFGWYKSGTWAAFRVMLKDKIERVIKGTTKPQEWYEEMLSTFPDDIDDVTQVPRGGRQPPGTDLERGALLARCRGVARVTNSQVEKERQRKARRLEGSTLASDEEANSDDMENIDIDVSDNEVEESVE